MEEGLEMLINVEQIIGLYCITLEDGQKIYDLIHPKLHAGESVKLDFTGVKIFASPFMNAAIGQLLGDIADKTLERLLEVENMTAVGTSLLRMVINNAQEYYSNQDLRNAVDEVLDAASEDI